MTAAATERSGDGGFVHLHVHTEYSMLDGAARLKDMFDRCVQAGMPAVAMTDHGNLYGAYDFWAKATKAGVKPIIGIEAYVAPEHRRHRQPVRWGTPAQKDDDVSGAGAYTHMTLLAETTEGLHNLFRLSSLASLEGYFRKPRMDRELLAAYADGIIATTGCPSGEVQTRLRLGQYRAGAGGGRRRTGTSSARTTTSSSSWTTAWPSSSGSGTGLLPHRQGTEPAVRGHQRLALHASRTTPRRTRCCCACRPGPTWPTRTGSGSTAPATT